MKNQRMIGNCGQLCNSHKIEKKDHPLITLKLVYTEALVLHRIFLEVWSGAAEFRPKIRNL